MRLTPTLLVAALAGSFGCGSPGVGSDGGKDAVGLGTPDGAPDVVDAPDAGDALEAPADAVEAAPRTGLPLPPDVASPLRLLDAPAALTGAGRSSCSHQEPASGNGDRWCSFRRPGASAGTELWVMNVSAVALDGTVPVCDGTDARCLRLSTTAWPSYGNDFEGDTLVFYSDAPAGLLASQPFVGPVSAWRPGWSAPHVIAPHAMVCTGHRAAAVAVCFDDPRGDANNPTDVVLRVGALADAAAPLPALPGRWPFRSDGSVPWQIGFSPDGETFAVSVPDVTPFVQNLAVIATRDVGTGDLRRDVLADVKMWAISNDGAKIFFYRGPRSDATLFMADFPAGTGETTLATKVVDVIPLGRAATDVALLLHVKQEGVGRAFRLLRDRAHPETALTVFTTEEFIEGVLVSPDLRYTAWLDPAFRGNVVRVSDLGTCAVNPGPAPEVGELGFLDDASYLFWWQPGDSGHSRRDGYLAPPDRCAERTRFAVDVAFVSPIGSRGVVYGDERDNEANVVTLKYAGLAAGPLEAAAGGVRVHERVSTPVTLVAGATGPSSLHVVYGAQAVDGRAAGVYLFGPVPF